MPDAFSLSSALSAAAKEKNLLFGRKLHAQSLQLGLNSSCPVSNALVNIYGKCHCPFLSLKVFREMKSPNEVSLCSLISSFVSSGLLHEARCLLKQMHGSSAMWNALIGGYADKGEVGAAISLFLEMRHSDQRGDLYTFSLIISLSSEMDGSLGFSLHGLVIKFGWISAVEVGNSMITFYSKIAFFSDAFKMFDELPTRTLVSWNAAMEAKMSSSAVGEAFFLFFAAPERNSISYTTIISGASRNGKPVEALELFLEMILNGFPMDELSLSPVLQSCSSLSLLQHGMMMHCAIIIRGFHKDMFVTNGLINMYAKCGDMGSSIKVFLSLRFKDLVSWNTLILGMSLHGMVGDAMAMYREMEKTMNPDRFTVSGMLMGCSHGGMVEDGMNLVREIGDDGYVMEMMDMVGRAGMDEMVGKLGDGMAAREDAAAEMVAAANEWCRRERWEKAEELRRAMVGRGMKKEMGCSWVEVRGKMEVFGSGILDGMVEKEKGKVLTMIKNVDIEMRS